MWSVSFFVSSLKKKVAATSCCNLSDICVRTRRYYIRRFLYWTVVGVLESLTRVFIFTSAHVVTGNSNDSYFDAVANVSKKSEFAVITIRKDRARHVESDTGCCLSTLSSGTVRLLLASKQ